jgi:hypothetical protein
VTEAQGSLAPSVQPSYERLLTLVPGANRAVREQSLGPSLVLWVPIRRRWWTHALGWFLPLRSEKGIALDRVGSQVWRLCDGRRDVERIIEAFAEEHRLRFHESRVSVLAFLKSLVARNLLVLAAPPEAAAGAGGLPRVDTAQVDTAQVDTAPPDSLGAGESA